VSPRAPLPARILIPVANPATAEDLVRIGADLLEPRTGELTALGIVEVPEEVLLSDGATRARQARRLLQKVLDYAPEGTPIRPLVRIGRRAADGIVEAAHEIDADLLIFGWGGRTGGRSAPAIFSPTIDAVVREPPCDIAVVKQRPLGEIRRILVPVRGGPHAELALEFATRWRATTMPGRRPPRHPAGRHERRPGPGRACPGDIPEDGTPGPCRRHPARGTQRPERHPAGGGEGRHRDHGRLAAPEGTAADAFLFGALPEAIAARAKPPVIVVKTRERISRATFDELAARR